MKRFTELLSGSAAVLFQVALTGWLFALSEINFDFVSMELNFLPLCVLMLGAYLIDLFMMRRGVPVPLFAAVQALIVALGAYTFVRCVHIEPFVLRTVIFNCIIYCLGFAVACFVAWSPGNQNGILLRFDGLAVMIVIMLVLDHVLYMPGASLSLMMCYFCICVCLLASISLKAGALSGRGGAVQGSPALGRIMLGGAFAIVVIAAVLLMAYASGGVKSFSEFLLSVITACAEAVKAVLAFIYSLMERLAEWLAQFADDSPMGPIAMEGVGNLELPPGEEENVTLPAWIYYILASAVAAVLVYIIFRLRKTRTRKVYVRSTVVTAVKRESGLGQFLRGFWKRLVGELSFRFNCLRYRKSCAGLLARCQKKAGELLPRAVDESGEGYLRRLGSRLGGEEGEALSALAEMVERSFYSPYPVSVPEPLYRKIRSIRFKTEKNTEAA